MMLKLGANIQGLIQTIREIFSPCGSNLYPWKEELCWIMPCANFYCCYSVAKSGPTLCDPMGCSMPGFPILTISQGLLKCMSIESMMPSNHLILCWPLLHLPSIFPGIRSFPVSLFFTSGGQSIWASASASVLPMIIQGWFPIWLTGLISLLSKGLSRVFSSTTIWKHQFLGAQPSLRSNSHIHTCLVGKKHSFDYTDLCQQSDVSAF